MKRQGVSIIECLIFLTIIILLLTVLSRLQITTVTVNTTDRNQRNANLQAFATLDIIAKDCMSAHLFHTQASDNGIVLLNTTTTEGTIDVGYELKNNNLRRITGIFNRNTRKWQDKKSSTILSHVTSFEVSPINSSQGIHVKVIFKAQDKEYWLERDIMMHNRVV